MSRLAKAGLALAVALGTLSAAPAMADGDQAFFKRVVGQWSGAGEIVAGKYEGTRFNCTFAGSQHPKAPGMALDGSCRVGLFSKAMRAEIVRSGRTYRGAFQNGADGEGLDVTSGQVQGDRMVVALDRNELEGAMVARLDGEDTMAITISVKVASQLVPVIGMNLQRTSRQSALSN